MAYNIEEIKHIRKNLDLTQTELAKQAGVSQSLITKIESCKIDPAYSSVIKIFSALELLSKKHGLTAVDIMQKKIIIIHENDMIKDAIKKMKKFEISQLPVVSENTAVGIVSESSLLNAYINKKESLRAKDIMEDPPPSISKDTSIEIVSSLLKFFQIVLVTEKGRPIGLISKADLLQNMYR